MSLRLRRPRRDKLDERLADARERAEDATTELELSRARAAKTRETVVNPLRRRGDDNRFADLLRNSLRLGYGNGHGS